MTKPAIQSNISTRTQVQLEIGFLFDSVQTQYSALASAKSATTRFFRSIGKSFDNKREARHNALAQMQDLFNKLRRQQIGMTTADKAKILYAFLQNLDINIAREHNHYDSCLAQLCLNYKNRLSDLFANNDDVMITFELINNYSPTQLLAQDYLARANNIIRGEPIDMGSLRFG